MDSRTHSVAAEALDIRMARLEGAYQQIDHRLATIEVDIRDLRGEIGQLRTDGRQQFYWIIGLIVVTILAPIGLRFLNP